MLTLHMQQSLIFVSVLITDFDHVRITTFTNNLRKLSIARKLILVVYLFIATSLVAF